MECPNSPNSSSGPSPARPHVPALPVRKRIGEYARSSREAGASSAPLWTTACRPKRVSGTWRGRRSFAARDTGVSSGCVDTGLLECMEVIDDGHAFNPLEAPPPDLSLPMEKRPIGGLGIHLLRELSDGITYERRNGTNRLVLTKRMT